jgi:hypothetical protein
VVHKLLRGGFIGGGHAGYCRVDAPFGQSGAFKKTVPGTDKALQSRCALLVLRASAPELDLLGFWESLVNREFSKGLIVRLFVYTAFVAAVTQSVVLLGAAQGGHPFTIDDSALEWMHFALALLAATVFLIVGRLRSDLGGLLRVLAAIAFMAAMRETDELVADRIFSHAYWIPSAVVLIWAIANIGSSPTSMADQISSVARSPAMLLGWFAVLVIVVFAQLLGQKELWLAVMETSELPYRTAKNMAEEGIETLGYVLLVCAAAETRWAPHVSQP